MSDRASSASFRLGPPSPSSPATGSLKANHPSYISTEHTPQTPTSPPLMSVSAQNYASNFASSQTSPGQATSQPANLSSPPSSVPMSTQASQQPTVGTTNSFPTPASSVNGHFTGATPVDDSEQTEKSFGPEMGATSTTDLNAPMQQTEYRRTDHDRQSEGPSAQTGIRDFGNTSGQDMLNHGDAMDIDKGTADLSNYESSLESLQKEFTSAFHLCKSSHIATGPDPSYDLVSLYGLGPVAKSVARMDPVTGEKINRLRKSYEGKLKGLGLAGRNKPVKQEPGMAGGLRYMTMWPEEEWQNQKVFGKEIKVADMDSALYNLQMRAMKMEPGTVTNNDYWEDILGHEKQSKHAGSGDGSKKAATPSNGARVPSQANGTPTAAEPERARPSRGRKRHYDDNSFVGYGEGYADDDDDGAFYSNSEGISKKKRKKDHVSKISTPLPERGGSYGVGMYGIGAR
ncbi:rox3 family protein [Aspergillus nomiae NRRL 13137]|uniref:Mediator of RNA polymerase II transcription subunit 19 n=1 Tax=Aspergillus nomiae NRRL (strain ATCC 15546 / NRRL 13137 / CBS 260.88 / M93) TaxID=1509407 RepID=A0A0L1JGF0_ASPN3|nr:rox3 family protein [Aspergillus nomiae NRRL 13137]KNG90433.1 rox3 family protein [Aspergillus nomiae NRRL 13137]